MTGLSGQVSRKHWAYKYIEYAHAKGIVEGFRTFYVPDGVVDRGQMAVFIARAMAGSDRLVPAGPAMPSFADVAPGFWAYRYIEYIAEPARGVAHGYPDGLYHPEYVCTRDQMAVYVARAFELPM